MNKTIRQDWCNRKKSFFITTTIPATLGFFRGQCSALNELYDVCAVSSPDKRLTAFARAGRHSMYCIEDGKRNFTFQ